MATENVKGGYASGYRDGASAVLALIKKRVDHYRGFQPDNDQDLALCRAAAAELRALVTLIEQEAPWNVKQSSQSTPSS